MSQNTEDLKSKVQAAKENIKNTQEAMSSLARKRVDLSKELPMIRPKVIEAEGKKRQILSKFIRDLSTQEDVDIANHAVLKIKNRDKEIADLLEMIDVEIRNEHAKIVGLNTALVSCEMKLWRQIYKNIQTDFLKSANIDRETLLSGWLAHARAGGIGREPFKDYLESLFNIEYTTEEVTRIREKLEAKYLK